MRLGANGAMVFALLVYAAIICIVVRIIKYFIRYGIDYYLKTGGIPEIPEKYGGLNHEPDHHPVHHRERRLL